MELISKDDAVAVAMHSKEPLEGIKNLPTVDPAAEVRRGRWMHHESDIAYCSNCDVDAVEDGTNYCPNCGAKMDLEG